MCGASRRPLDAIPTHSKENVSPKKAEFFSGALTGVRACLTKLSETTQEILALALRSLTSDTCTESVLRVVLPFSSPRNSPMVVAAKGAPRWGQRHLMTVNDDCGKSPRFPSHSC